MDAVPHKAMMRVTDACGDEATVLALSVVRMVAAGYSTGDVACWDLAYAGAERLLAPEAAGRLVGCLTALVRAVRATRRCEWCFMPASCCRTTNDERGLIAMLAAARAGERVTLAEMACAVTGAACSCRVQTAVLAAADTIEDVAQLLSARPGAPATSRTALH